MPNLISLEEVKTKLPLFAKIIDSSYKGMRYKADFIDIEFNEPFTAHVRSVIELQMGCSSRTKQRRGKPTGKRITVEKFQAALPPYLKLIPETWKALRHKAKFYDTEYKVEFEMYAGNVYRTGKGYCKERQAVEFRKAVMIPVEEIQQRLNSTYGNNFVIIEPSSYCGTNEMANFIIIGRGTVRCTVDNAIRGELTKNRGKRLLWRTNILVRDNYTCQVTGIKENLHAHHIFSKATHPELQFNENNGITLTSKIHREFHTIYGKTGTTLEQLQEFLNIKRRNLKTVVSQDTANKAFGTETFIVGNLEAFFI